MLVCVCVCVYVCMYVCMYACMRLHGCDRDAESKSERERERERLVTLKLCVYMDAYACAYMHDFLNACVKECMCICPQKLCSLAASLSQAWLLANSTCFFQTSVARCQAPDVLSAGFLFTGNKPSHKNAWKTGNHAFSESLGAIWSLYISAPNVFTICDQNKAFPSLHAMMMPCYVAIMIDGLAFQDRDYAVPPEVELELGIIKFSTCI
jgi:hypothetical protein